MLDWYVFEKMSIPLLTSIRV